MPVKEVTPYMRKAGEFSRRGQHLLMVVSCEYCFDGNSAYYGKWISKMRAPTEEEQVVSDVMQT